MATTIQLRRGTAAAWTAANPTLGSGEAGFETDTGLFKIGDGATAWNALAYADAAALSAHVSASDPHTGYLKESVVSGFATPSVALGTAAAAGSATTAVRTDATIVAFDATVPVAQAFGDTASAGSASTAARRDHRHGMPTGILTSPNGARYGLEVANSGALSASLVYVLTLKALGPAGYWRFNGDATDAMGANDGTAVSGPNLSATGLLAGDANTAWLSAASESKYVTLPTAIKTILNGTDWTFGAIVKFDPLGAGGGDLLGPHSGSHARCMSIAFGSGTGIGFADGLTAVATGVVPLSAGVAAHVAWTYTGGHLRCYKNGGAGYDHDEAFSFGGAFAGTVQIGPQDGTIDECFIAGRAFSAAEIAVLYAARV